jgi:bacterioferritin (cytochrome b1)
MLREERRAPLEFELEAARNLINIAQRDLDTARDETQRRVFREVLAERRAEAQRLERELQAVLRF